MESRPSPFVSTGRANAVPKTERRSNDLSSRSCALCFTQTIRIFSAPAGFDIRMRDIKAYRKPAQARLCQGRAESSDAALYDAT